MDRQIDDLISGLGGGERGGGGSGPGCGGKKKRGLLDGVADIFKTALGAFKCIGDVVNDIADNVAADNIAPVAGAFE